MAAHEADYLKHEKHTSEPNGQYASDPIAYLHDRTDRFKGLLEMINKYLSPSLTQTALGESGHGGNEEVIVEVAAGIVQVYASMMEWAQDSRSVSAPDGWSAVFQALSEYADMPIRQFAASALTGRWRWGIGSGQ